MKKSANAKAKFRIESKVNDSKRKQFSKDHYKESFDKWNIDGEVPTLKEMDAAGYTMLTQEELAVVSENPTLKGYLTSLDHEVEQTPRSWLYDGKFGNRNLSPGAILNSWVKGHLSSLKDAEPHLANVYQFDISQLKKWGPQGGRPHVIRLYQYILPSFVGAKKPKPKAFDTVEWSEAKRNVLSTLRKNGCVGLRPASYQHVVDDMRVRDTLDSKSGWPLHIERKDPKAIARAIDDAVSGAWRRQPAIILFRNYNQKIRPVWMYPMATNLVEGSFFQPLQTVLMNSDLANSFFSPWKGFEQVRAVVTQRYAEAETVVSASDFSSTDAHFQKYATSEVCDVLEQCFVQQYRAELRESLMHMHEIPLVISEEFKLTGDHGVSSGSNWTNFVETLFDMIFAEYLSILSKNSVHGLYAIGDDQAYISTTFWGEGFKKWLEEVGKSVGHEIKAEKTTSDRDQVKTLQRLFQRGYFQDDGEQLRGVYPTIRALRSCVYPERFHSPKVWTKDMFCVRIFMILENCVDHPLFEEFVRFVCEGNRLLIPFAKRSRGRLIAAQVAARQVHGLLDTYNQEKRDQSLADFASIRVASKL